MIFTSINELVEEMEKIRKGKKIVLATGTFDLFHYDHLKYLQGAKDKGQILVVAVKNNKCASLKNPERPIIDEKQRIAIVDNIKCVDASILVDYDPDLHLEIEPDNSKQREWLLIFQSLFKALKPDILYYENNAELQSARDKVFEKYGITGVMKERGTTTSTTEIIKRMGK